MLVGMCFCEDASELVNSMAIKHLNHLTLILMANIVEVLSDVLHLVVKNRILAEIYNSNIVIVDCWCSLERNAQFYQ